MQLDPRLDDLLDRWEAESFVPSAEQLCADCPEVVDELKSRMQQLLRMNRRLSLTDRGVDPPQIAGYDVHSLIGEGGMGTVWAATQVGTQRRVALKIMTGWQSAPTRARERFRREVELASRLEHPNIARVYDGDVRHGIGYYAMELIDGVPLDRFTASHELSTAQVIEQFSIVCRAVHHAHQRGIIHRDLKPSNILVDTDDKPHVLDFGLAKELSAGQDGVTLDNVIPGTPRYMSPEQAAGRTREIDVRSDVFSLGVILYELLMRQSPYGKTDDQSQLLERVRAGRTEAPRRIDPAIDRDLEAILTKALEPELSRRYASADAFADDLRNYLSGMPIIARRRTAVYVARKWLARNRTGAAIAALLTVIFAGGAIYSYVNILHQRRRAQTEADISKAVNSFVLDRLLTATDPAVAQGTPPTLRELLDRAAVEVDTAFKDQPLVESGVRLTIGKTYLNLGAGEPGERQLRRAVEIREKLLGPDDPSSLEATADLAFALEQALHLDEAETMHRRLLEWHRQNFGEADPRTLTCLHRLGNVATERLQDAEAARLFRLAYVGRASVLGAEHPDTIWSMSDLGAILGRQRQFVEAEQLLRGAVELRLKSQGPKHIDTLNAQYNLAAMLRRKGDLDQSERMLIQGIADREKIYGPTHPSVSLPIHTLGVIRLQQERYAEAYDLASRAFRLRGGHDGLQMHGVMQSLSIMVRARAGQGESDEAKQLIALAHDLLEQKIQANDTRWVKAYCESLAAVGSVDPAREIEARLRQHLATQFGADDPRTHAAAQFTP